MFGTMCLIVNDVSGIFYWWKAYIINSDNMKYWRIFSFQIIRTLLFHGQGLHYRFIHYQSIFYDININVSRLGRVLYNILSCEFKSNLWHLKMSEGPLVNYVAGKRKIRWISLNVDVEYCLDETFLHKIAINRKVLFKMPIKCQWLIV